MNSNNVKPNKQSAIVSPSAKTLRNRRRRQVKKVKQGIYREEAGLVSDMVNLGFGPNRTRGGVEGNPADPRSGRALRELGQTPGGRQAVIKILHPCMEESNTVTKIPDGAASTSVVMERRDEYVISANVDITMGNYNVLVISMPFLVGTTMVIQWQSGSEVAPGEIEQVVFTMYANIGNAIHTYPNYQTFVGATSSTNYYATFLQASVLSPVIAGSDEGVIDTYLKTIRRTYMGITTDFDGAALTNQGRVVSGQWSPDIALALETTVDGTTTDLKDAYPIYESQTPAVTITNIVASDEFNRRGEARDGSYMPFRPCNPVWDFTPAQEWRNVRVIPPGTPLGTITKSVYDDVYLRGWCVGVEFWDGLDHTTNLRIKRIEGLELIPAPASTFSPFATPALPDDMLAKQVIQEFCRKQAHAYPADYNDSDRMLPSILGGIANALSGLGIPVISQLAGGVGSLMKGPIGDILGSLF